MLKKYKAIATDMDGTLLTSDKKISEKTKNTLLKLQEQGVTVILCTGRQFPGVLEACDQLELDKNKGILIPYNGAKIIRADTKEVLFEKSIPNELAVKILKHIEKFDVSPIVDDGKYIYAKDEDAFRLKIEAKNNNIKIKQVENIADSIDFDPCKILIAAPSKTLKDVSEEILKPFLEYIDYVFSTPCHLEINLKGVSKGAALSQICEKINISKDEVIAFGDGGNDVSLFKEAGLAVAMDNACDELKKIADEITLSNNEDGLIHTINKYFITTN